MLTDPPSLSLPPVEYLMLDAWQSMTFQFSADAVHSRRVSHDPEWLRDELQRAAVRLRHQFVMVRPGRAPELPPVSLAADVAAVVETALAQHTVPTPVGLTAHSYYDPIECVVHCAFTLFGTARPLSPWERVRATESAVSIKAWHGPMQLALLPLPSLLAPAVHHP